MMRTPQGGLLKQHSGNKGGNTLLVLDSQQQAQQKQQPKKSQSYIHPSEFCWPGWHWQREHHCSLLLSSLNQAKLGWVRPKCLQQKMKHWTVLCRLPKQVHIPRKGFNISGQEARYQCPATACWPALHTVRSSRTGGKVLSQSLSEWWWRNLWNFRN